MMTSLTIDGYRSIKHLELTGLKKINLLVGKNNSGKSSVLEAVGLATTSNPMKLMFEILNSRQMKKEEINPKVFFYMLDNQKMITLTSKDDNNKIKTIYIKANKENLLLFINNLDRESDFLPLKYSEYVNCPMVRSPYIGTILIANYSSQKLFELLSTMNIDVNSEKKQTILKSLQAIDNKIQDISTLAQMTSPDNVEPPNVYIEIGMEKAVPIGVLGDGVKRLALIIASIIERYNERRILLIDEIDTGFHYSALKHLWKTVLYTLNKQEDLQLFATTHSDECVRALYEVLSEEYPDNINDAPACLIRLERGEEQHYATNYEPDVMMDTLESSNNSDTALVFHEQKYNK